MSSADAIPVDPKMWGLWPTLGVTAMYLYFVLSAGPKFMASRKAFTLKPLVILYNAFMVFYCFSWVYKLFSTKGLIQYWYNTHCHCPLERDEYLESQMTDLNRTYFLMKVVDLMDTVFFVLKKNHRQISFLHVYHHSSMVVSSWHNVVLERASFDIFCMGVNTAVHVIMYFYYFLSSLGPVAKKYLFWKKYVTIIQLSSFMVMLGYVISFNYRGCEAKFMSSAITAFLLISNTVLFLNFFRNTYKHNKAAKTQ